MSGTTSHYGANRGNFTFESSRARICGIVNGVGEGPNGTGRGNLLWFSVKYLSVVTLRCDIPFVLVKSTELNSRRFKVKTQTYFIIYIYIADDGNR
jgi:hypothetical protein